MSTTTTETPYHSGPMNGRLPSLPPSVALSLRLGHPIDVGIPIYYDPQHIYRLDTQLVSAELVSPDKFVATLNADEDVDFVLTLVAKKSGHDSTFESGEFSLNYNIGEPRARAHFVATTLMAIFALSGGFHLKIPEIEFDQRLNITLPVVEISRLLQRRQMAYRLMVIEKATGINISLPSAITQADKSSLAFVYHAIVDRSFVWHRGRHEGSLLAQTQCLDLLPSTNGPFVFPHTVDSLVEVVLSHPINLGRATVTIEDAVIDGLDKVREEMARNDGHEVKIDVESLSGQVRYSFSDAPRLPEGPWDLKIQTLIDLEAELDSAICSSYNDLAAATLDGLTTKQKAAITARPELGEEAFPI